MSTGPEPDTALLATILGLLCIALGLAFGYAVRQPDSSVGRWTRSNNWDRSALASTRGFRTGSAVLLVAGVGLVIFAALTI